MRKLKMVTESGGLPVGGEPAPPPPPAPPMKSRKKLYTLLGLVGIAVVVSALVLVFFVPRGLGETIPYSFNYAVGEKMTYNMSVTTSGAGASSSDPGTVGIDVLSFDGANYTMNETISFTLLNATQQFSATVKMDKSGRIVEISNLPSQMQQLSSMFGMMPGFGFPSNKTEAQVGETWQIPLNQNYMGVNMSGTFNYKFGDVQNFTVPAGTYKAFKIEVSTDNFHASAANVSISINMIGEMHLEYGTCRLLDMNMQATETLQYGTQGTQTMTMNMQMQLTQHIRP